MYYVYSRISANTPLRQISNLLVSILKELEAVAEPSVFCRFIGVSFTNNFVGINVEWTENLKTVGTASLFNVSLQLPPGLLQKSKDLKCWLHNRLFLLGKNPFRQTALTHESNFCGSFRGNLRKKKRTILPLKKTKHR